MIVTRKAAVGFLLLAVIVFPTVYYTTPMLGPTVPQPAQTIDLGDVRPNGAFFNDTRVNQYYRLPLISFKERWQAPAAVTVCIELFALICYIALKKLEPAINKAAEKAMRNLREQNEREQKERERAERDQEEEEE